MAKDPFEKIAKQIKKAGLPTGGAMPFRFVDVGGRIWIKDRAHGEYPDHWDVQEDGGERGRTRVDSQGNILP